MDTEEIIKVGGETLLGDLVIPDDSVGLVVFASNNGSNRPDLKNKYLADELNKAGTATLLFDLLTEKENQISENRLNIELLTDRLVGATKWCQENPKVSNLKIGYLGANTGAAAALSAAAFYGTKIKAVVSRAGRPDMTGNELDLVETPTLLIVGGEDKQLIDQNRKAYSHMGCEKKMEIVPGATNLFEEEGTLERVAELAVKWFGDHWNK